MTLSATDGGWEKEAKHVSLTTVSEQDAGLPSYLIGRICHKGKPCGPIHVSVDLPFPLFCSEVLQRNPYVSFRDLPQVQVTESQCAHWGEV